jgi:environmental stress-induced protein Ves
MRIIRASNYRVMPWKNGGGSTTEIAVFPAEASLDTFEWRISMAHVGTDGPFSSFPGIDRTLAVLAGGGIVLASDEAGDVTLDRDTAPHSFPGERAIAGRLINGPIDDLNVMTRRSRWTHAVERLSAAGPHSVESDGGTIVLVARTGAWQVRGTAEHVVLEAGDTLIAPAPDRLAITGAGDVFVIRLLPTG